MTKEILTCALFTIRQEDATRIADDLFPNPCLTEADKARERRKWEDMPPSIQEGWLEEAARILAKIQSVDGITPEIYEN